MLKFRNVFILILACCLVNVAAQAEETSEIKFERQQLDAEFRSEGVAVADFNRDGKLDIAAGYVWYEAPDWKPHSILEETPVYEPKGYSNSFANAARDLDGDGWVDLMVVDFPGQSTWWFKNPGESDAAWRRHELTPVSNNESPQFIDLVGDETPEWVMGVSPDRDEPDGPNRYLAYLTAGQTPEDPWQIHRISEDASPGSKKYDHGLGIGDINGDGRQDVVVPAGWWEQPTSLTDAPWRFHAAALGEKAAQMYVFDIDDDGDADVVSSSAHDFGIWWHEQLADSQWRTHEIDTSFSQTHGLCLADMNQDGLPDLVTGKRWWAHGGRDPGGDQPAVFYWFELSRKDGKPAWTPHIFDHNSGPGTQFTVEDIDQDGTLDVATSNKKGVHIFLQQP